MEMIKHKVWLFLLIIISCNGQSAVAQSQSQSPYLEWRDEYGDTTARAAVPLLAKTAWPARVTIDGDSCHLYRTGIFFKTVQLQPGLNRIVATVQAPDGPAATFTREICRTDPKPPRQPWPLWIDSSSVQPVQLQQLQSRDRLRAGFTGARGHMGWVEIKPGKLRYPLKRSDFSDYSRYEADVPLSRLRAGKTHFLRFVLKSELAEHKKSELRLDAKATVLVQPAEMYPLLRVTKNGALLTYNLGPIRLGGPLIAELSQGVVLQSSGRSGDSWRVRLDDRDEGYIANEEVENIKEAALFPSYYITSMSASPGSGADVVTIPRPQLVPYALLPDPASRVLRVRLYGVKSSSTWITHRENLRAVDRLSWEQLAPETYQVNVHLQSDKIWGYTIESRGGVLELRLKHPPAALTAMDALAPLAAAQPGSPKGAQAEANAIQASQNAALQARPAAAMTDTLEDVALKSPAAGLKVAIEAGHGGSNLGAVGLSGMEEKIVNLDVAQRLEKLCLEAGIGVLQVRGSDTDMSLGAKKDKVEESDADLLVSIHANSGGTANGYLGASGTSTYYNNPFWGDFARIVYSRLLQLPLQEFGCVGSFNYRVIRMSSRPAILVELAFMSNAADEEKLFLPEFRQSLAEKILAGIQDFADFMRDQPAREEKAQH